MAVPKLGASISTQPDSASQDFVYTEDDYWSTTSVPHVFTPGVHVLGNIDLAGRMNQYEESGLCLVRVGNLCSTRTNVKLIYLAWDLASSNISPDTGTTRRYSAVRTAIVR
jgi:hypothetical protein